MQVYERAMCALDICPRCERRIWLDEDTGCDSWVLSFRANRYSPVKCGEERQFGSMCTPLLRSRAEEQFYLVGCGSCGVATGEYHHEGCREEECPRCNDKLVKCACNEVRSDNAQ